MKKRSVLYYCLLRESERARERESERARERESERASEQETERERKRVFVFVYVCIWSHIEEITNSNKVLCHLYGNNSPKKKTGEVLEEITDCNNVPCHHIHQWLEAFSQTRL